MHAGANVHKCRSCGLPIDVHQHVRGRVCQRPACLKSALEEQLRETKQRHVSQLLERARRRLKILSIRESVDLGHTVVAVVPTNEEPLVPSDPRRHAAFRGLLSQLLDQLQLSPSNAEEDLDVWREGQPEEAVGDRWQTAAMTICQTCRGQCCQAGATHAWLDVVTLREVCLRNPELSTEEIQEAYAARLPDTSYEGSCVFHEENGCALPRELRSSVCNTFLCDGIASARPAIEDEAEAPVLVLATEGIWPSVRFAPPEVRRAVLALGDGELRALEDL